MNKLLLGLVLITISFASKSPNLKNPHVKPQQYYDDFGTNFKQTYGVQQEDLEPIIFVPGLGGSGIQAKLERNDVPAWYCFKTWDWFGLWVSLYEVFAQECWLDNMVLNYNESENTYSNNLGVATKPHDFGGLKGIDYLDHTVDMFGLTAVFADFIKHYESVGYKPGKNLFGAPFDWRYPVDTLYTNTSFATDFKKLIEHAYEVSGNKKVHLLGHSMGGKLSLYFLNRADDQWKKKYIASFIPVATPWSGSVKALKAVISGDDFGFNLLGFSLLQLEKVSRIGRTAGGVVSLIPEKLLWGSNQVFVQTPSKKYTSNDFDDLFVDIGSAETAVIHQRTYNNETQLNHPEVTTYCLYGYGVDTPITLHYPEFTPGKVHQPSHIDYSDKGDGTVPLLSLQECQLWESEHAPIKCREYDVREHVGILADNELIEDVLLITTGRPNIVSCETDTLDSINN
eukprot:TRINITY_DN12073_c0_g1_i1.p1 TRINITY_DN12073_c0_g1~~TRINITY_DN12073_c0_g1_i1.p1  ORF type:complete len:462 (-),score=112.27 TRINITY_DN12073_c0_g1_i1:26-1390(-)